MLHTVFVSEWVGDFTNYTTIVAWGISQWKGGKFWNIDRKRGIPTDGREQWLWQEETRLYTFMCIHSYIVHSCGLSLNPFLAWSHLPRQMHHSQAAHTWRWERLIHLHTGGHAIHTYDGQDMAQQQELQAYCGHRLVWLKSSLTGDFALGYIPDTFNACVLPRPHLMLIPQF
jgi:hypothetical protein